MTDYAWFGYIAGVATCIGLVYIDKWFRSKKGRKQ